MIRRTDIFYLLSTKNDEGRTVYLGRWLSNKEPFYLSHSPEAACRFLGLADLFILLRQSKEIKSFVNRYDFTPMKFEMELEQISFAIVPMENKYDNMFTDEEIKRILALDTTLLSEKELEIYNKEYDDE